jgi:hypothetical protein
MINLHCGYDRREHVGWEAFVSSVRRRTEAPLHIIRMGAMDMPVGTNEFTYSRFLVPYLCDFKGHAIFCDGSDQIMLADVAELDALFDPRFAVQVVKHPPYNTRHPVKYIGTEMECPNRDYARKNWASVMLFNCEHPYWRPITPATLKTVAGLSLLQFGGLQPKEVGELPNEWNRLVDEGQPVEGAKICHWTAGIPAFHHYRHAPGADLWRAEQERAT